MPELLKVQNLKVVFNTDRGKVQAVDGVSYHIHEREIIGLVGESGCGKSVSQLAVLRLIPTPPGKIADGKILFEGQDLLKLKANGPEIRAVRGGKISIVFQEPMTSLNPVLTIGSQITEMIRLHLKVDGKEARDRAVELLSLVNIPEAEKRLDDYPHQFSGGMRQRVMIAMAISCNPKLIIADEPTTALDVTTQAQLLELMQDIIKRLKTSLLIVTHNLGVVARYSHRVYVMYAGHIVESGTTKEVLGSPRHPYTIGLLKCLPRLNEEEGRRLVPIVGMPPNLINMPPMCAFRPRCPYHIERCRQEPWPELSLIEGSHYAACYADTIR